MKPKYVAIQMKANEQYFYVVLLYKCVDGTKMYAR